MSENVIELIKRAEAAYDSGSPIMTDAEYDALTASEGVEQGIGGAPIPENNKYEHAAPMLSLGKAYEPEEIESWWGKVPSGANVSIQYKYDGMALCAIYSEGILQEVVTRGDGRFGEKVTRTASKIKSIPNQIDQLGHVEIRGEAYISIADFEKINEVYEADYSNPRNTVAGSIRRLDNMGVEIAADYIQFAIYDTTEPVSVDEVFIETSVDIGYATNNPTLEWINECIEDIEHLRPTLGFEIDGAVIKIMNSSIRESMGATSHHPRWAIAWKYEGIILSTIIRQVIWDRGRTGRIVPVAHFDTINLGTKVSRATLHNASIFSSHNLHEGDTLLIKKAGDVIPYFIGSTHEDNPDGVLLEIPSTCPECGEATTLEDVDLMCTNKECGIFSKIVHAVSVLGVKGVSGSLISALMQEDQLLENANTVPEALDLLINIERDDIMYLPSKGETSANKAVAALSVMRGYDIGTWITSLGIPGVGNSAGQELSKAYGSLQAIIDDSSEDMLNRGIPLIGWLTVEKLYAKLDTLKELQAVLEKNGIEEWVYDPSANTQSDDSSDWFGKNVVVTGVIDGMTRKDASTWLESQGAIIQGAINKTTNALVAGEKAGSKLAKAQSVEGCKIIDGDTFLGSVNSIPIEW